MKIEIRDQDQKQKMFIKAEAIMKFVTGMSDELDTLIMCKAENIDIMSNDYELYKAVGSITDKKNIDYNRLVKFLEVVDVNSFRTYHKSKKPILTDKEVQEINDIVSKNIKAQKNNDKKSDKEAKTSGGN